MPIDTRCEFTVTFPHRTKERTSFAGELTSRIVESADPSNGTYLRAEFTPLPNDTPVRSAFRETLQNFARLSGIQTPEITIGKNQNGQLGTYSGSKSVGGHSLKLYGKVSLGESSMIHCMVVEPLDLQ
jgi:hypothetical protein